MATMTWLSHADRKTRRKQIAEFVRKNGSTSAACAKAANCFDVSLVTVRSACREHDVDVATVLSTERAVNVASPYPVIADLILGKSPVSIAENRNVSRQRVYQIKQKMTEHGVFKAVKSVSA